MKRIRLHRQNEPTNLYAESGIASGTYVHVQNQSLRHSVWIHAGDAQPAPSPELNGYFELHPGELQAFQGATLFGWSEQHTADLIVSDKSGILICGVSAASANGIPTVPVPPESPTIDTITGNDATPLLTGTLEPGTDLTVEVNGIVYTTASGLVVTSGTWSLQITSELPDGTYDVVATSTSTLFGTSSTDTTTGELVVETVLAISGAFDASALETLLVEITGVTGGTGVNTSYEIELEFVDLNHAGRVITITGSDLASAPTNVDDSSGISTDLTVSGTMASLSFNKPSNDIYGSYNITLRVTDDKPTTAEVIL